MPEEYCVTDVASLRGILSLKRGSKVVISLPSIAADESRRLQDQINRLVSECGCNFSALALIAAVAACALSDAEHWSILVGHALKILVANLAACFLAAGIGKSIGLLRARRKLARIVKAIEGRLSGALDTGGFTHSDGGIHGLHQRLQQDN
jgi:predicted transcriptional regulator